MKIDLTLKLKSPLCHFGDERMGTMQVLRTMKFFYMNKYIDIPVYSGNALRGILRRYAMKYYVDSLNLDEGISTKLFYMLFSGGAITSGSRYEKVEDKRIMRKMCPPLALFGTAIGDQITEGKLKCGILKPVCKELNDYNDAQSDISIYDMLEDIFYTRRDDLKSQSKINVKNKEVKVKKDGKEDKKKENPVQMKYEIQAISTGSVLEGRIIIENENEIEKACIYSTLHQLDKIFYIGGKSATGHGEIELNYNKEEFNIYDEYIKENKNDILEWIIKTEGIL